MSSTLTPGSTGPTGPGAAGSGIVLDAPRAGSNSGARRQGYRATKTNFELYAWLFMRLSGILLVFLVLGHLLIMLVLDGGVQRINFAFVAGRWSSPFWQVWDLLQLWLAELHGVNGLRTIINDYTERDTTRFWLKMLLYTSALLVLFLGTLVIFTFEPTL